MILLTSVLLHYLFFTQAKHHRSNNNGPPCFGRSGCVVPFAEDNYTIADKNNDIPVRHVKDSRFKSPIFGANRFNPITGEFEKPDQDTVDNTTTSDLGTTGKSYQKPIQSTVMRAAYEPPRNTTSKSARRINDVYIEYF